jgi:hypothetical protein
MNKPSENPEVSCDRLYTDCMLLENEIMHKDEEIARMNAELAALRGENPRIEPVEPEPVAASAAFLGQVANDIASLKATVKSLAECVSALHAKFDHPALVALLKPASGEPRGWITNLETKP